MSTQNIYLQEEIRKISVFFGWKKVPYRNWNFEITFTCLFAAFRILQSDTVT